MEIVAAIVGGVFSVGATYLAYLLSRRPPEVGGFTDISRQRTEGVRGIWHGELLQPDYPGGAIRSQLRVKLDVKRATIVGTIAVTSKFDGKMHGRADRIELDLKVRGGFYADSLLKLDYKNTTVGVLQFGTMVLAMNARSTEMTGWVVGYGSYAERVIHGSMSLYKSES